MKNAKYLYQKSTVKKLLQLVETTITALIYATEEDQHIQKMATDVQSFFTTTKSSDSYRYFLDHYFFLKKRSWTWGSRWDKKEASKHLRILNAMFGTGIVSDEVKKILHPDPKDGADKE